LAANDIVLAEIRPMLDLDDDHLGPSVVLDPVPRALGHGDHLPWLDPPRAPRDDDSRGPADHDPALGAKPMPLQAQAPAGLHDESLDLVSRAFLDRLEAAPRARHEPPPLAIHRRGPHGPTRTMRAKSASTAFSTSSITSSGTFSSSSSTTMARPRLVRRPTCMEAILTMWRPRMEPILPTTPGRSS